MSIQPEIKEATPVETAGNKDRAERPSSTAEVARDLERPERNAHEDGEITLFPEKEATDFHKRWTDIQTGFVDEPRRSVEQADGLVAEVIKRLANSFADERAKLEGQWGRGDNVSTEDLRISLRRYRAFFDRLLNV